MTAGASVAQAEECAAVWRALLYGAGWLGTVTINRFDLGVRAGHLSEARLDAALDALAAIGVLNPRSGSRGVPWIFAVAKPPGWLGMAAADFPEVVPPPASLHFALVAATSRA